MKLTTRKPLKQVIGSGQATKTAAPPRWLRENHQRHNLGDGLSSAERNVARGCAKDDQS